MYAYTVLRQDAERRINSHESLRNQQIESKKQQVLHNISQVEQQERSRYQEHYSAAFPTVFKNWMDNLDTIPTQKMNISQKNIHTLLSTLQQEVKQYYESEEQKIKIALESYEQEAQAKLLDKLSVAMKSKLPSAITFFFPLIVSDSLIVAKDTIPMVPFQTFSSLSIIFKKLYGNSDIYFYLKNDEVLFPEQSMFEVFWGMKEEEAVVHIRVPLLELLNQFASKFSSVQPAQEYKLDQSDAEESLWKKYEEYKKSASSFVTYDQIPWPEWDNKNIHEILKVKGNGDIKAGYKKMMKRFAPDYFQGLNYETEDDRQKAIQKATELSVLLNKISLK